MAQKFGLTRSVEAKMGGIMLLGGAGVTLSGVVLPHSPQADESGYVLLALALAACAGVVAILPRRFAEHTAKITVALGILGCTGSLLLNGESRGGAPMLNELFYIWPILFAGFFFPVRTAVAYLLLVAGLYGWSLQHMGVTSDIAIVRVLVVTTVLAGVTAAMRSLRLHIDRLMSKLHELARTDVLTGLLNRRAFDERLAAEVERAKRTNEPVALVLGDVDHFKALNDQFGHEAGDQALTWVAQALTQDTRQIDTVARIGGEEFALILPGTSLEAGVELAERLRERVRHSTGAQALTMSFGVVEGLHQLPDDLLRKADRALYAAKAAGRDRTMTPDGAIAAAPHPGVGDATAVSL